MAEVTVFFQPLEISFKLPAWVGEYAQRYEASDDLSRRMAFVIGAARENVEQDTGGPFAAAVFETDSGKLVSLGVNLVISQGLSALHAEMVALAVAQRKLGHYDLGGEGMSAHELLASAEPCAMCLGAIPWSGVSHVATAACDEDARAIGFDEGTKPVNWTTVLESRGIKVTTDIAREEARQVFQLYKARNGYIYNSRKG